MKHRFASYLIVLFAAVLLGGCASAPRSGGYYEDDGPDTQPRDVSNVPDAVPRIEPRAPSGNKPYTVFGVAYTPLNDSAGYRERGVASWYGKKFHGRRTSSGEPYDMYVMTAAHRTLPLPSYVRVTNLQNGRSAVVRVNDRGPFLHNRLIDLSYAAANKLGVIGTGTAMVEVESVAPGEPPSLSAPRPTLAAIPSARAAERTPPRLIVQVGAFSNYANATQLRDRLHNAGFGPIYIEPAASASPIFRVRLGPVANVEQGDRLVADVGNFGIPDALLIVE